MAQVPSGWTGSVDSCLTGTESDASIAATLTAVNTLRSFAGIGAVTFDPEYNRKALAAALMMKAADSLSHYPDASWPCYSDDGAAGAGSSNLFLGRSGAAAMPGYVEDAGVPSLGHRRWLLNPAATVFGTGSTGTTNALWVLGPEPESPTVPELVAWPPPGHVPWPWIAGGEWSAAITLPGAVDVSAATVSVVVGGRAAEVAEVTDMGEGYGAGPMLKWQVGLTAEDVTADRRVEVTIDGVTVDGQPHPISYVVDAMHAGPPEPVDFDANRSYDAITVTWPAAVEHGVPVSGYRVSVREGEPLTGPLVAELQMPADARSATVPYTGDAILWAQVVALSRAGEAETRTVIGVGPPPPPPPPPPVTTGSTGSGRTPGGASATAPQFAGAVRIVRSGRLRPGSRLRIRARVTGAARVRYRWLRNGRRIAGSRAARRTYRVTRHDRGKRLSCRIVAIGADGRRRTAVSPPVRVPRR